MEDNQIQFQAQFGILFLGCWIDGDFGYRLEHHLLSLGSSIILSYGVMCYWSNCTHIMALLALHPSCGEAKWGLTMGQIEEFPTA